MTLHIPLWAVSVGLSVLILWQILRPERDEESAYGGSMLRVLWLIPLLVIWLIYAIIT